MSRLFLAALMLLGSSYALAAQVPKLGFYAWDAPSGPQTGYDTRAAWLGRPVELGHGFTNNQSWSNVEGPSWQLGPFRDWIQKDPAHRSMIYTIYILPGGWNGEGPDGVKGTADDVSLKDCAAGKYNTHWTKLANNLVAYKLSGIIIRPGHEFTGGWYAWGLAGGTPQQYQYANYAGCFKQLVTTMRAAQPTATWKYDWNPVPDTTTAQLAAAWPGDEYVDYVTTDAYDTDWEKTVYPYPAVCDATCRLNRQKLAWSHLVAKINRIRDFAKLHGKPLAFTEWGVWAYTDKSAGGGDNPYYIEQMFKYMSDPTNNVAYHSYFDVKAGDGDHQLSNAATQFPQSAATFLSLFKAVASYSQDELDAAIAKAKADQLAIDQVAINAATEAAIAAQAKVDQLQAQVDGIAQKVADAVAAENARLKALVSGLLNGAEWGPLP